MFNELATTPYGRLLSAAIALALIGGGASSLMHGTAGIGLMGISLLGSVVISIMALSLASSSKSSFGLLSIILLPFLLFLYSLGLQLAMHSNVAWASYASMGLGALIGINGLRGGNATSLNTNTTRHAEAH